MQFNKDHSFKINRDSDMAVLQAKLYAFGLPKDWRTNVAESSITITNPKRNRVLKFDSYRTMTIDVIKGINVKSTKFTCDNVDELWLMVEKQLNAFLKLAGVSKCIATAS